MKPRLNSRVFTSRLFIPLTLAAALLLPGCGKQENKYVAPPPPEVTVSQPAKKEVTHYEDYTGTTSAYESVEIRARVEGYLETIKFQPGAVVNKGDILFVIDPKPFQAKLNQAKADLSTAEANFTLAKATLTRKESAFKDRAVSEVEVIQARADLEKAKAAVESAKASIETAEINLGYTSIHAPIEGMISRNMVDVGNLVGAGQATLLATIRDYDPIYAYFSISETDLLYYIDLARGKKAVGSEKGGEPTILLGLADESDFPHEGKVDYIDNTVDPDTGTIQIRAVFDNKDHFIVPGLFVRLRIPFEKVPDALLVPDQAVGMNQGGSFLYVVNEKNEVEFRKVEPGILEGHLRVIDKGLEPNDWVIVNGLQRVRPGMIVKPTKAEPDKAEKPKTEQSAG